ncbi:RNA polymerase sigma factor [Chloroflexota bacterium]
MTPAPEGNRGVDSLNISLLVKKATEGDSESFGKLYDTYLEPIYRYVYHQVRDNEMAEDITQEVFIKAWKVIKSCRGRESTFKAWLYRIAHNHTVDCFRRQKHESRIDIDNHDFGEEKRSLDATLDEIAEGDEASRALSELVFLPDNQRQVVILKFIEGLDNQEISKVMGKSQGAIRVLQFRALAELRKRMLDCGFKDEQ